MKFETSMEAITIRGHEAKTRIICKTIMISKTTTRVENNNESELDDKEVRTVTYPTKAVALRATMGVRPPECFRHSG